MNELYHYGTLGMKWNRRKYSTDEGKLNSRGKSRYKPSRVFRKSGARFKAPGEKVGNLTTMYRRKHGQKRRLSKSAIKKMGGRTVAERTLGSYGGLKPSDPTFLTAAANGQIFYAGR